jgi:long-chain acyl-CoA synthetase
MHLTTAADLPFAAAEAYADMPAWRFKTDGGWQDVSFREVAAQVRELAAGLVAAGVRAGDRVCVLADTRPEWSRACLAIMCAGAIVVPIYPSSSADECTWILEDSGATLIVCENATQLAKVGDQSVAAVTIEDVSSEIPTLAGLAQPDQGEVDERRGALRAEDPSMIIYTSGTTGRPKGCVLTHSNWLALAALAEQVQHVRRDDVVYLFLPLAHVFAEIVLFASLYSGATVAYYGGDPQQIVAELAQVRPTFLPSVPRIFEKIYTLATTALPPEQLAAGVRALFGGRLRQALTGAAPIAPAILEFFHAAGVPVLEGYGMTESTGVGTVNLLDRFRLGKVGVAAPGVQVKIADDGEVLMAGPHVFAGYWRNPIATAEALNGGWLHTGDLGELDDDGFLTITGRKKDIIITAGGKNIAPAVLENELRQSRWISHAVMFGDRMPYPVALLTLDADEILPWAAQRGLPSDIRELAAHPDVLALVQGIVDQANAKVASVARIKRFTILDRDLTQETGELTPTLKIKRKVVHTRHADRYAALYAGQSRV